MSYYQICNRCVMDTTDPFIHFDSNGVCNHCIRYDKELSRRTFRGEIAELKLSNLVNEIKKYGKNKEYDCIIGVSGGVDSTYVALMCKRLGLRPLAIHFDNGWNSELAVSNIEKTLDKLQIDLYTFVIDWDEFRDLQISFLKSSTTDCEVPTDHAVNALLFREASKRGIKYIINGMNFATESINMPGWSYGHSDWRYIKSIHSLFSRRRLKSFPRYSFYDLFIWFFIKRIKVVSILNYTNYNKDHAMQELKKELDWTYYGGKHYESVYTRFFQGFILPTKFNIDKRKAHFSDMINSGQLSRDLALSHLLTPPYDKNLFNQDYDFVLKKLGLTENEFSEIMNQEKKSFKDYPNNYKLVQKLKALMNYLRKIEIFSR